MRRTHVLPTSEKTTCVASAPLWVCAGPVAALDEVWRGTRRDVRRLHEKLFYRPLLTAVAKLPAADARIDAALSAEAARETARRAGLP